MTKRGSNAARDLEFRGMWCDVMWLSSGTADIHEKAKPMKNQQNKNSNCWPEEKLEIDWRHVIKRTVASWWQTWEGRTVEGRGRNADPVVCVALYTATARLASLHDLMLHSLSSSRRWSLCVSAGQGDLREAALQQNLEFVCVALSSLVLSFLSFCPSPFSGTTNDDDGRTDGRTTKNKYDYFHFSITRNLFLQAKFGEIKRESKKSKWSDFGGFQWWGGEGEGKVKTNRFFTFGIRCVG